ncbi:MULTISPECIES: acyltransferase family protein [Mumia]|uniref:acyltransferase family protein n=1 Tax=Mumia TaxID=1546255 RepID=UPI00141F27BD|nr:acyltransferase [Mumia sp. ZJ430]
MTAGPVLVEERAPVFPVLDTLRAIAALFVLTTHTAFQAGLYTSGAWGAVASRLDIGVAIFFVLSGFLLGRPYLLAIAERRRLPGAGRYLWKRALRILPVYWIAVVAAMLLLEENHGASPLTWVKNLTLTTLYGEGAYPLGLAQMWSLAVEVAFYLVLPLLALLVARLLCRSRWHPGRVLVLCAVLVAVNIAWTSGLYTWMGIETTFAAQWLPAYLSWFAAGLALATVSLPTPDMPQRLLIVRRLGETPWTCWVLAAALLVISSTPVAGPATLDVPTFSEATLKHLLYAAIAGLVVLPGVFAPDSTRFGQALSVPWARHLGHISYGLFCVHMTVLMLVFEWRDMELFGGRWLELWVLTLAISLAVAEILYRVVERPSMRLRNLGRRKPPTTQDATSPSPTSTTS